MTGRAAAAAACALLASTPVPAAEKKTAPSTQEMAATLADLGSKVNAANLPFVVNDRRAAHFAEELTFPRRIAERLHLRVMYARELLNAGRIEECLQAIDVADADAKENAPPIWQALQRDLPLLRALAYMRIGEEQNCHLGNTADSCLLPIRGAGRPQAARGLGARDRDPATRTCSRDPDNLRARWLLNIAHMTLGTYPDGVPAAQLIPPDGRSRPTTRCRASTTSRARPASTSTGSRGGAILDDFDGDGRLDLMRLGDRLRGPDALLPQPRRRHVRGAHGRGRAHRRGGRPQHDPGRLRQRRRSSTSSSCAAAGCGTEGRFPLSLLRNNGDGTFADVTTAAGLLRFDADADRGLGRLRRRRLARPLRRQRVDAEGHDPKTPSVPSSSATTATAPSPTSRAASGVDVVGFVKGVVCGDYDNDGRPDLYVSRADGGQPAVPQRRPAGDARRRLALHATSRPRRASREPSIELRHVLLRLRQRRLARPLRRRLRPDDGRRTWPPTTSACPTTAERGRLYRNRGDGTFEDVTRASGSTRWCRPWAPTSATSTTTAGSTSTSAPATPTSACSIPTACSATTAGRASRTSPPPATSATCRRATASRSRDLDDDGDQDVFEQMGGAFLARQAYSDALPEPGQREPLAGARARGHDARTAARSARASRSTVEGKGGTRAIHRRREQRRQLRRATRCGRRSASATPRA